MFRTCQACSSNNSSIYNSTAVLSEVPNFCNSLLCIHFCVRSTLEAEGRYAPSGASQFLEPEWLKRIGSDGGIRFSFISLRYGLERTVKFINTLNSSYSS